MIFLLIESCSNTRNLFTFFNWGSIKCCHLVCLAIRSINHVTVKRINRIQIREIKFNLSAAKPRHAALRSDQSWCFDKEKENANENKTKDRQKVNASCRDSLCTMHSQRVKCLRQFFLCRQACCSCCHYYSCCCCPTHAVINHWV